VIGPPQTLAEARSCAELVDAFRARKEALGLSNEAADHLIRLTAGHVDKVLSGTRGLSALTLDGMLSVLGLKLLVAIDPDQVARMRPRWEGRDQRQVRPPARIGAVLLRRARPVVMRAAAKAAVAARWSRTTPETRREIMRAVWMARRNVRVHQSVAATTKKQTNGPADR
jgi:hypothetical protein